MINYNVYLPGGLKEVILGLGAINWWIQKFPEQTAFNIITDDTTCADVVKYSGLASKVEVYQPDIHNNILRDNYATNTLYCELNLTNDTCIEAGQFLKQHRVNMLRKFMPLAAAQFENNNDPATYIYTCLYMLVSKFPEGQTAGSLLPKEIAQKALWLEDIQIEAYCNVPKRFKDSAKDLLRKTIKLYDNLPVKDTDYFVVDCTDRPALKEILYKYYYNGNNQYEVYPLLVEGSAVNGVNVEVPELIAIIGTDQSKLVIGADNSWIPYAAQSFSIPQLILLESQENLWSLNSLVKTTHVIDMNRIYTMSTRDLENLVYSAINISHENLV